MRQDHILARVIEILGRTLPHAGELHPETRLLETGALDSISLANLILDLEDGFRCSLPEELLRSANFATPRTIALMCERVLTSVETGGAATHDASKA